MKIAIVTTSIIIFTLSFLHYYLKKIKPTVFAFYTSWFLLFASLIISSSNPSIFNESFINTFALLFFVWLTLLPVIMYNIVCSYFGNKEYDFKNYYLPATLFLINVFCLIYFGLENDKNEFIDVVVENVMSYVNYIIILFIFPISTIYYTYKSFKIIGFFSSVELFKKKSSKNYMTFFILLYVIYIIIWVFQNYILNESFFKSLLKAYYVFYFILSYYCIYKVAEIEVKNNNLDQDIDIESLHQRLMTAILEDKIYLNPKLTVKDLAREIGSNEKYVSNLINKKNNMNFSNFINTYRVDYAKLLLFDEEYSNFTIEAIGGLAGFNSKSGFNATFKKVTGLTPTQFKTNKKT